MRENKPVSPSRQDKSAMTLGAGRKGRFKPVEKPKALKETVIRLLKYLFRYRLKLFAVIIFVIISTVTSLFATRLIGIGIDNYILKKDLNGLLKPVCILSILYIISCASSRAQNLLCIVISQQAAAQIRADIFRKLQRLPIKYFDARENGEIMSRITNDVDNIASCLNVSLARFISAILTVIGVLYFMITISPVLTVINFVTIPCLTLLTKLITKHSRKYFQRRQAALGKLNGKIEETVSGQKTVKAFVMENDIINEFNIYNNELKTAGIKAQVFSGLLGPISIMINNMGYGFVAVMGGVLAVYSIINLGSITSFLIYSKQFGKPFNEILQQYNSILSAIAGAERVFAVLDETEEPKENEKTSLSEKIAGNVDFINVTFGYTENSTVLKNINLSVKAGQTVALVGHTGAGKTTVINLFTRFYDIEKGEILIDKINIKKIGISDLRLCLGIVLQDTCLFSENIMENIRYGRLNASDNEVIEAAKLANAHEFIKRLPHGYKTELSENADNLSQGQKQMLSIARAILANHPILILDEATSNVDSRTEVKIQKAMLNLMKGRTSFVIAHRLSTVKNADIIVVINNGKIAEKGTHKELLDKKGIYFNLYQNQFSDAL